MIIFHADTALRDGSADFFFLVGAVDVDVAFKAITVGALVEAFFEAFEP